MKNLFLPLILFISASACYAQTDKDYAEALAKFQGFYNAHQADSIFSMMSDRAKKVIPADKIQAQFNQIFTQVGKLNSYQPLKDEQARKNYKATFDNGVFTLTLLLTSDNKLDIFRFSNYQKEEAFGQGQSEIILNTASGSIYGTLEVPSNAATKMPVVLFIAGSGPTDRDGNSSAGVAGSIYLQIADSLSKQGIATLRYDKRGVGKSAPALKSEADLTFDNMISDAAGFIEKLKADDRFSSIIILGHSEGSLIGIIAAEQEKINAFISVAGAGTAADRIIEQQLSTQSKELEKEATSIIDSIKQGYSVNEIPYGLSSILRPDIQPYLRSWFKYDPSKEIKKLNVPVLITQGTTDIQISTEEATKLKKAYPKAQLTLVTGMNHVLKQAPENRQENIATYTDAALPVSTTFLSAIEQFIRSIK